MAVRTADEVVRMNPAGFEPLLPRELGRPSAAQVSADRRVLSLCWSTGDGEVIRLDGALRMAPR